MECLREYRVRAADYFADGGADNAEGVRKRTFRAFGRFLGGISVYSGHDIFIRGIEQKRRLNLPQSQIVSMELTKDTFRVEDFVDRKTIRKQANKRP